MNRKFGKLVGFVTFLSGFYVVVYICNTWQHPATKSFLSFKNNPGQQVIRNKVLDNNQMIIAPGAAEGDMTTSLVDSNTTITSEAATNDTTTATTTAAAEDDITLFSNVTGTGTGTGTVRPKLILHLGPPKTSTSTIQCSLGQIQEILNKDNYYYIGSFVSYCSYGNMDRIANHTLLHHFHYHDFYICLAGWRKCMVNEEEYFKEFHATFDYHLRLGHNLIYSSEHLSKLPWSTSPEIAEKLKGLFDGFDVEVIFTYRDYFALLVSTYTQFYRYKYITKRAVPYPGVYQNTRSIPSFSKELDSFFENAPLFEGPDARNDVFNEDIWENLSYIDKNLNQEGIFNLKYFRMEQDSDEGLITNFVCQMIPGAIHACSHFKEEDEKQRAEGAGDNKENTSSMDNELEADQLATAIYEKGWINGTSSGCDRIPIQNKLRSFLNDMKASGSSSYPLECPNRLDELLLKSQEVLNQVGEWFEEEERKSMEDAMNKKWSDYIERKKFCSFDIGLFIIDKENEIKAEIEKISCSPRLVE